MRKYFAFFFISLSILGAQGDFTAGFSADRQYFIIDVKESSFELQARLSREQGIILPDFGSLSYEAFHFGPILPKGTLSRLFSTGPLPAGSPLWRQGAGLGTNPDPLAVFYPDFGFDFDDFSILVRTRDGSSILGVEAGTSGFSFAAAYSSLKAFQPEELWFPKSPFPSGGEGFDFMFREVGEWGSFFSSISRWEGPGFGFRSGGTFKIKDEQALFAFSMDVTDGFWRSAEGKPSEYLLYAGILMEEQPWPQVLLSLETECGQSADLSWKSSTSATLSLQGEPFGGSLCFIKKSSADKEESRLDASISCDIGKFCCRVGAGLGSSVDPFVNAELSIDIFDIQWSAGCKIAADWSLQVCAQNQFWNVRAQFDFPAQKDWTYDILIRINNG
jgi:hypothetical protein